MTATVNRLRFRPDFTADQIGALSQLAELVGLREDVALGLTEPTWVGEGLDKQAALDVLANDIWQALDMLVGAS